MRILQHTLAHLHHQNKCLFKTIKKCEVLTKLPFKNCHLIWNCTVPGGIKGENKSYFVFLNIQLERGCNTDSLDKWWYSGWFKKFKFPAKISIIKKIIRMLSISNISNSKISFLWADFFFKSSFCISKEYWPKSYHPIEIIA